METSTKCTFGKHRDANPNIDTRFLLKENRSGYGIESNNYVNIFKIYRIRSNSFKPSDIGLRSIEFINKDVNIEKDTISCSDGINITSHDALEVKHSSGPKKWIKPPLRSSHRSRITAAAHKS